MIKDEENKKICVVCKREKSLTSFTITGRNQYRRKICKVCVSQGLKIEKKSPMGNKVCCACEKEKPMTEYYKNKNVLSGYSNKCKMCHIHGNLCRKKGKSSNRKTLIKKREVGPSLFNVKKEDWIETYKFLESIGYDLNKNIHEQFCIKHGLKKKKRTYEKSIQYSPKELGLI